MPPRGRKAFVSRVAAAARTAAADDADPEPGKGGERVDDAEAAPPKSDAPPAPPPAADADADADAEANHGPETRGQMVQRHKRVSVLLEGGGRLSVLAAPPNITLTEDSLFPPHTPTTGDEDAERGIQAHGQKAQGEGEAGRFCIFIHDPPLVTHPPLFPPPPPQDEAAAAETALAAKHTSELAALEAAGGDSGEDAPPVDASATADALARFGVDDDDDAPSATAAVRKTSRAARRRADKAARDAEREAERDAERAAAAGAPSARGEEAAALDAALSTHALTLVDIPPDGHCLYASLADQLERAGKGDGGGVSGLRAAAAGRLRSAAHHFAPFIEDADGVDAGADGDDPVARVAAYADAVETTAAWGGHCEVAALAAALGVRVRVFTASSPPTIIDGDAGGGDPAPDDAPTLTVAYLRHAYGLGEHYNSTAAAPPGSGCVCRVSGRV